MTIVPRVGIVAVEIRPDVNPDAQSLEELLYHTTRSVLSQAGLDIDDIDGIVVGANDQLDGRAISIMMASGPVGGVDRDILSTPSASEHALVMGALRVASGQYRTQLILAWSPTEASSIPEVERLGADPYFHRRLPLDETSSHALQASVLEAQLPGLSDIAERIALKNRAHGGIAYPTSAGKSAKGGVLRWPLRPTMTSPPTTGVVALVLASADFIDERGYDNVAWVQGMGWATEPAFLGDRQLATLPALSVAVQQAYAQAGVQDPLAEFDIAEVADTTPFQEMLAYEGLGLCGRKQWGAAVADGRFSDRGQLPVNLSGGALSANPVFCTGLIRIAEAAKQVLGEAGAHQAAGVKRAVAHAASGFAMQYNTVFVLGRQGGENV